MNSQKFNIPLFRIILQWINRAVGYIGSFGEVQLEPEKWRLIGHDGVTPGGIPLKTDIDDVIRAAVVAKTGSYNDLKDKPALDFQPYDDDLTAIAQLVGAGLLRKTAPNTWELDTTEYVSGSPWTAEIENLGNELTSLIAEKQDKNSNLTAIAQLVGSGFLKKTNGIWYFDSNSYLTEITKAMVETVLTGQISSHTHQLKTVNGETIAGSGNIEINGTTNHANLNNLDFENSGHSGFAKQDGDVAQEFSAYSLSLPEGWSIEVSSTKFMIKKSGITMIDIDTNKQVSAGEFYRGQ